MASLSVPKHTVCPPACQGDVTGSTIHRFHTLPPVTGAQKNMKENPASYDSGKIRDIFHIGLQLLMHIFI